MKRKKRKKRKNWRSEEVYRCAICHTKTNYWVVGGWPCRGPRLLCPGDKYKEHDDIERLYNKLRELDKEIDELRSILRQAKGIDNMKAQRMIDDACAKKELYEFKIQELRGLFIGKTDDLKDVGPDTKVVDFIPTSRIDSCAKEGLTG